MERAYGDIGSWESIGMIKEHCSIPRECLLESSATSSYEIIYGFASIVAKYEQELHGRW